MRKEGTKEGCVMRLSETWVANAAGRTDSSPIFSFTTGVAWASPGCGSIGMRDAGTNEERRSDGMHDSPRLQLIRA